MSAAAAATERVFDGLLPLHTLPNKPRNEALTEIRGPYYSALGQTYFADLFEAYGWSIDSFKFACGSFALMPEPVLRQLISLAHDHDIHVSTGGFLEWILARCPHLLDDYLTRISDLGFDIVEVSNGLISASMHTLLEVTDRVQALGLKVKPEVNVQFGAGGGVATSEELRAGRRDAGWAVHAAERYLERGVGVVMVESEGITENVDEWRTDVIATLIAEIGLEHLMFEAADPRVFAWYVQNFGPNVNLFVDHSQTVQLAALRSGTSADASLFGRVVAL